MESIIFQFSCPEITDDNDGFCDTTIVGSVGGTIHLAEDKIVYSEEISNAGVIVKLGILCFETHSIIFAGTTTGLIGKVYKLISLISADLNTSLAWFVNFITNVNMCRAVYRIQRAGECIMLYFFEQ